MTGKFFGLRGGDELRNVRCDNFTFESLLEGEKIPIIFTENQSKTNQPGLSGAVKTLVRGPHVEDTNNPYSFTQIFDFYLKKLPKKRICEMLFCLSPGFLDRLTTKRSRGSKRSLTALIR
jgi:hypothetical protein